MAFELRDYQLDITQKARSLMVNGVKRILITAPTGSGKTVLTASMLDSASKKSMDSVFLVHRRELIKQSTNTFSAVGVRHGIIAANFPKDPYPRIQLASVQTIANRVDKIRKPKLIIWDECHHLAAAGWTRIFNAFPDSFHVGLTATPERLDGKGLGTFFQEMIRGPEVEWLIGEGYLSNYKIFCPPSIDLRNVHVRMGDYVQSEISALLNKPHILGDTLKLYVKHAFGKRAVVFAPSVEHSKNLVSAFKAAGIRAAHIDGETEATERDVKIEMFKNGTLDVLSNVGLFSEGFDVPAIEAVIDVAPTLSLGSYLQRFGRALRPIYAKGMPLSTKTERLAAIQASDKKYALYLDQVGNIERHGLPDEIRNWSLDGREKTKKDISNVHIRICKKCFAAMKAGTAQCGWCGFEFPIESRVIEQVAGDLIEVDPEQIRRNRAREQGTANTEAELVELGRKRGYKRPEAWARHLMLARGRRK